MAGGAEYSVSGKLIDSVSKKPIAAKEISVTTDGNSPKGTDTTNSKGEFEVNLKAPDNPGKYDIKAHFDGDSQYKSSDSSVKITVEETTVSSQKTTVKKPNTDEQQTDEQQTDEQQTDEQQTDEQQTDEQQTDEQQTDEQQTDEQQTDEQQTEKTEEKTDEQQTDEQQTDEQPEE